MRARSTGSQCQAWPRIAKLDVAAENPYLREKFVATGGARTMSETVEIKSQDFWVKVVEMLQQNWALVDCQEDNSVRVCFVNDTSGVFDEMGFQSINHAETALKRNGFCRFSSALDLQTFLRPPNPPFRRANHPNGPIYSSGRFWRS